MPTAGDTHDITLESGGSTYGFMIEPGSYLKERIEDFAPRIAQGNKPALRENFWDVWAQSGAPGGVDQYVFASEDRVYRADGNVWLERNEAIQLDAAWTSSDAGKTATAPMIVDLVNGGNNFIAVGVATKVRRYNNGAGTWADSTTTFGANCVWLQRHGAYVFAATGSTSDFYRTSDLDTWTQPAAGQKATAFTVWNYLNTIYLVKSSGSQFSKSSDSGATWDTAVSVGDGDSLITGLGVHAGLLIIGTETGLYAWDGTNVTELVYKPQLKYSTNFRAIVSHDGFLYTHLLGRILKLSLGGSSIANQIDITPEMVGDSAKELYGHGIPVWLWAGPYKLYAGFDDGENDYPEILAYNGLGWHQVYRGASNATLYAGGYSRLTAKLWLNDGATRYRKVINLRDRPDPTDYAATGEFQTSDFDAGVPFMWKAAREVMVEAEDIAGAGKIAVSFSTDKGATWTALSDVTSNGKITLAFASGSAEDFQHIRFKVVITRNSATATPRLRRLSMRFLIRPDPIYAYRVRVRLGPHQTLRDGTAETFSIPERLTFLQACEASKTPVVFADMDGSESEVYVSKTSVRWMPEEPLKSGNPDTVQLVDVVMIEVAASAFWDAAYWNAFNWA